MVYLLTFSAVLNPEVQHEDGLPLCDLEALTHVQIRDAVLDAVANPEHAGPRAAGGRPRVTGLTTLKVAKMVVFMEKHANGSKHFHVALKLSSNTRWLGLKLALRRRSCLASHWSASHSMFWSAVRYGTFATERKPQVDGAPLTLTADGKPPQLVRGEPGALQREGPEGQEGETRAGGHRSSRACWQTEGRPGPPVAACNLRRLASREGDPDESKLRLVGLVRIGPKVRQVGFDCPPH